MAITHYIAGFAGQWGTPDRGLIAETTEEGAQGAGA